MPKAWEADFPNLGKWNETSLPTKTYNCIAFAANDQTAWWDPLPPGLYYWPHGVTRSYDVSAFIAAYKTCGYEVCADGSFEPGFEKIAIYTNASGGIEHAARQLANGRWASKMGTEEDISHESPESLSGGYGNPTHYMRKAIPTKATGGSAAAPSVPQSAPSGVENLQHREDFTSLVNAAARKQKPTE